MMQRTTSFRFGAGVLPLQLQALEPISDPQLGSDIAVPSYVVGYGRAR